jgi:hypothetical protein
MEHTIRYEPDKTMKKDRWHVTEYSQNIVAVSKKQLHFVHHQRQRYNVVMDLLNLVNDPDVFQGVQPMLAEVRPSFVKKAACLVEVVVAAVQPCFAPEEVAAGLRSEDSPVGFFEQPVELGVLS